MMCWAYLFDSNRTPNFSKDESHALHVRQKTGPGSPVNYVLLIAAVLAVLYNIAIESRGLFTCACATQIWILAVAASS